MSLLTELLQKKHREAGFYLTDDPALNLVYLWRNADLLKVWKADEVTVSELWNECDLWATSGLTFGISTLTTE